MQDRQRLIWGSSTVLIGGLASVAIASGNSMVAAAGGAIAGGTAGMVGGTILSKKRDRQFPVSEQLVDLLGKLGDMQGETKFELIALKGKIDRSQADFKSELKGLKSKIDRNESELSSKLKILTGQIEENKTELATLKNRADRQQVTENPASVFSNLDAEIAPAIEGESEVRSDNISQVVDWFKAKNKNINIESYRQTEAVDPLLDRISMSLGEGYPSLKSFYKKLKYHLQDGSRFWFRLAESSAEDIRVCTSFCTLLNSSSFLSYYRYSSQTKEISAAPQTNPKMTNFLQGEWFERFVYKKICNLLLERNIDNYYACRGIQGKFDTQRDFELDLLFLIDNEPLWIECKAGQDYNLYLKKYSEYRKKLGIPKERSFMVILDLTDAQTVDYTNLWDISVANINNFIELIDRVLDLSEKQENNQIDPSISSNSANNRESDRSAALEISNLLALLNRKALRPAPEYRQVAIEKLIKLLSSFNEPLTINQIKDKLAETLQVSKHIARNIVKALKLAGCFLNESGEIVNSYNLPVSRLVSLEAAVLEQKCMESYAAAVLAVEPNYFENSDNISNFERITGGKTPDYEIIELLKMRNTNTEES
ncbi:MAG: DUF1887 family protein [Cyanosarcina radialis HA8281-LM2]|nr:DUF1887 family protein [Cyanosarcina radialis HA8281-LM2]